MMPVISSWFARGSLARFPALLLLGLTHVALGCSNGAPKPSEDDGGVGETDASSSDDGHSDTATDDTSGDGDGDPCPEYTDPCPPQSGGWFKGYSLDEYAEPWYPHQCEPKNGECHCSAQCAEDEYCLGYKTPRWRPEFGDFGDEDYDGVITTGECVPVNDEVAQRGNLRIEAQQFFERFCWDDKACAPGYSCYTGYSTGGDSRMSGFCLPDDGSRRYCNGISSFYVNDANIPFACGEGTYCRWGVQDPYLPPAPATANTIGWEFAYMVGECVEGCAPTDTPCAKHPNYNTPEKVCPGLECKSGGPIERAECESDESCPKGTECHTVYAQGYFDTDVGSPLFDPWREIYLEGRSLCLPAPVETTLCQFPSEAPCGPDRYCHVPGPEWLPFQSQRWRPIYGFCQDSCVPEGAECIGTTPRANLGNFPDQCCPGTKCRWQSDTKGYPFDDKEGYFCVPD